MSTVITFNGASFTIPAIADASWGTNVSNYLIAISSGALQKTGGAFTLTAEVDFGSSFGLKALYLKSKTANIAAAGFLRLARADTISWRNQANGADLPLGVDASDNLTFNGVPVGSSTDIIPPEYGGTGIANNAASTITITGAFGVTFTLTALTSVTLPTTGTLATLAGVEVLTNKTLSGNEAATLISGAGTLVLNTADTVTLPNATDTLVGKATADILTNKDIDGGTASNTLRITVPKNTTVNLDALTRKEGTILYDTDLGVMKYDTGAVLNTLATNSVAAPGAAGIVTSYAPIVRSDTLLTTGDGYIALDGDGYRRFLFSTGASSQTFTLPATPANNANRVFEVVKVDALAGQVQIVGTVNGSTVSTSINAINVQYGSCTIYCDGTAYYYLAPITEKGTYSPTLTPITNMASITNVQSNFSRVGNSVEVYGALNVDATASGTTIFSMTLPIPRNGNFASIGNAGGTAIIVNPGTTDQHIYGIRATSAAVTVGFVGTTNTANLINNMPYSFNYRLD